MALLSIIIPAHNEADFIDACLSAVFASAGVPNAEVIVVANGCDDATANRARSFTDQAAQKGWELLVLDLSTGGKPGALNAGDTVATGDMRAYLDADTVVSKHLFSELIKALSSGTARYASGQLTIPTAKTFASRAYANIYRRVPFIRFGVPGAGLFAVNKAGRARWDEFPPIISDDSFVRLNFSATERIGTAAPYEWPLVEGFANLIRVRRRQNAGVAEVAALYPDLTKNDDTPKLGLAGIVSLALRHPVGFAIYAAVALIVRLTPTSKTAWDRGR